jgi:putative tricarboxylic transport membrane protein
MRSGTRCSTSCWFLAWSGTSSRRSAFPLAPFTLPLVLGNRAEDAFRLSMIGAGGDLKVFWSNGLVGSITTLGIILLFWPAIDKVFSSITRMLRPAKV